jgi:hypothetical protein
LPENLEVDEHIVHSEHLILKTKVATYLTGLEWSIKIDNTYIHIGYQKHTIDKWANFTDDRIKFMDKKFLGFWKEHKEFILSEAEKSQ